MLHEKIKRDAVNTVEKLKQASTPLPWKVEFFEIQDESLCLIYASNGNQVAETRDLEVSATVFQLLVESMNRLLRLAEMCHECGGTAPFNDEASISDGKSCSVCGYYRRSTRS